MYKQKSSIINKDRGYMSGVLYEKKQKKSSAYLLYLKYNIQVHLHILFIKYKAPE